MTKTSKPLTLGSKTSMRTPQTSLWLGIVKPYPLVLVLGPGFLSHPACTLMHGSQFRVFRVEGLSVRNLKSLGCGVSPRTGAGANASLSETSHTKPKSYQTHSPFTTEPGPPAFTSSNSRKVARSDSCLAGMSLGLELGLSRTTMFQQGEMTKMRHRLIRVLPCS